MEFDYIIVGGGPSAVGIIYGLLQANFTTKYTVALVEQGPEQPSNLTHSLSRWYAASHEPNQSVAIEVGRTQTGRAMDVPLGRGLGGTSLINGGLIISPCTDDFRLWPEPWATDMMQSVQVIRQALDRNKSIQRHSSTKGQIKWNQDPIKQEKDLTRQTSFENIQRRNVPLLAKSDWTRNNYYSALIEPLLQSHHGLTIIPNFRVQTVVCQNDGNGLRAVGIRGIDQSKQSRDIRSRKQVILCAGAISTPCILWASKLLSQSSSLPLYDQVLVPRVFLQRPKCPASINGVDILAQAEIDTNRFQFLVMDGTIYSDVLPHVLAGIVRWKSVLGQQWLAEYFFRSIKLLLTILIRCTPLYWFFRYCVVTMNICLMNPRSAGELSMDGNINLPYFLNERDFCAMEKAWYYSIQLISEKRLGCHLREIFPGLFIRGRKGTLDCSWFRWYIQSFCAPYFHYTGTCAMGNDPSSIVDPSLQLRGVLDLRICDASVFPNLVSAPPALTCAALGYTFAKILLQGKTLEKR